jgi:hypothetical protein
MASYENRESRRNDKRPRKISLSRAFRFLQQVNDAVGEAFLAEHDAQLAG